MSSYGQHDRLGATGTGHRRYGLRLAAAVLAVMLIAVVGASPVSAQQTRPGDPATAEAQFFQLLNAERARVGLAALQYDANLVRDARVWSGVMAQQDRLYHTSTLAADTARSIPDWQRAGENIGFGWTVQTLHDKFVASPPHYKNITGDFTRLGVGVVYTDKHTWVTFRFAKAPPSSVAATTVVPVSAPVAASQVRRLYLAFFKREPDVAGSKFWVDKMVTGYPLSGISTEFIKSAEFRNTYGSLSNDGFITLVYQNVLGRAPDSTGHAYWVQKMSQGMGRGSVMVNFSESAEFKAKTA